MEPAEELCNLTADPLEMSNLANDPSSESALMSMRDRYDKELNQWKEEAVPYNNYQIYTFPPVE